MEEQDDFEFEFPIGSAPGALQGITADEIFSKVGSSQISVFNRELVAIGETSPEEEKLEEDIGLLNLGCEKRGRRTGSASSSCSTSSEIEDSDRLQAAGVPVPNRRKSSSTGTSAWATRTNQIRNLVVRRSRSDGKDKLVEIPHTVNTDKGKKFGLSCINPNPKSSAEEGEKKGKAGKVKSGTTKELDIHTAHRVHYGRFQRASSAVGVHRSYLPYRQELIGGLFAGGKHLF
ncbi:hypothetical protein HPP92_021832 [Vanilla planifolia]|uniref:Uncharacterized protein n=1 Tax=Vanilla planifolia TaxID=51239 RepID=A0A835PZL6_VANPL|nr:hypothetical protein HPP92_021832 [Vanilla planifolia]